MEGILLKLERAAEHLAALREALQPYATIDAPALERNRDPATGEYVLRLPTMREPPAHAGVLIGDFVQNCRSALDHLAWQLVHHPVTPTDENRPRETAIGFPIYREGRRYSGSQIRGSTKNAQAIVEALQPYHDGDSANEHPLWLLHGISNWDKHRVLHTVANALIHSDIFEEHTPVKSVRFLPAGPMNDGAELVRYALQTESTRDFDVQFIFATGVTFRDGPAEGHVVLATLTRIFDACTDTLVSLTNELCLGDDSVGPLPAIFVS